MFQESSKEIYNTILSLTDEEFGNLDLKDKQIDLKKLRPFLSIIRKLTEGNEVESDLKQFADSSFTADEVTFIANLKTHLTRTGHFSETLEKHKNKILQKVASDRIGKMKDSGMSLKNILDVFANIESIESFTTHPTYTGSLEYTKAHSEYLQCLSDYFKGRCEAEDLKKIINRILSNDFNKRQRLTVDDERQYMIMQLGKVDESVELTYNVIDEVLEKLFGDEYNPADLNINYKKHVWGGGCDVDGNTAVFWQDTAKTFKELLIAGIKININNLKDIIASTEKELPKLWLLIEELEYFEEDIKKDIMVDRVHIYNELCAKTISLTRKIHSDIGGYESLKAFRYVRDNGLKLGKAEYRQTADIFDLVLKNFIPVDVIHEFAGGDIIAEKVKNFADLSDPANLNLKIHKEFIDEVTSNINSRSDNFKFLENFEQFKDFVASPCELDRRQSDIFSEISYELCSLVQSKVNRGILSDPQRFSDDIISKWLNEAVEDVEKKMADEESYKRSVTETYDHVDSFFYQTIKRYQLVKHNPFMLDTDVLAEADKPNDVFKKIILFKALGIENVKHVELYESPEILMGIKDILRLGYSDKIYYQEVVRLGIKNFEEKYQTQLPEDIKAGLYDLDPQDQRFGEAKNDLDEKVKKHYANRFSFKDCNNGDDIPIVDITKIIQNEKQIAHSDNGRRASIAVARFIIADAVEDIRMVAKEYGIEPEFFHGWSVTDPLRGGMRAISRMFNQYATFAFEKHTTQNMDGHVIYPNRKSGSIFIMDKITNAALNYSRSIGAAKDTRQFVSQDAQKVLKIVRDEFGHKEAIKNLFKNFKDDFYYNEAPGYEMAQIQNGANHKIFGNVASRRNSRKSAPDGIDPNYYQQPSSVRSISVSESAQHAGDHNYYVMAREIKDIIYRTSENILNILQDDSHKYNQLFTKVFGVEVTKEMIIKTLYELDPSLTENMSRGAQSVAFADIDHIWERALRCRDIIHKSGKGIYEVIDKKPHLDELDELEKNKATSVKGLLAWRQIQHRAMAELVYVANMGDKPISNMTSYQASELVMPFLNMFNRYHARINKAGLKMMDFLEQKLEENFKGYSIEQKRSDKSYEMAQKAFHTSADVAIFTTSPTKNPAPFERSAA